MTEQGLAGKTALVTGASKGIGYAIAEAIGRAGGNLVICARNKDEVELAARRLEGVGDGAVLALPCDVRRYEDVRALVTAALDRFDRVDVLVNNAGVGEFGSVGQLAPEAWHRVIETNLNGVFYACHEVIPHMTRRGGGWIINIGSLAGKNPFAGGAAYNASKFGLLGFSEAMMLDVRDRGIRVCCIMPGSVESQFSGPGLTEKAAGLAPGASGEWKLQPTDIAEMVMDLLAFHSRALPSRIEMRPSQPPKKG